MNATTEPRGTLHPIGPGKLGLDTCNWHRCPNCASLFPEIRGHASCNGTRINKCPYCREDSRPWFAGRGL